MHSIPARKSYTHQNSSTTSSQCKGSTQSTKQPTHYYTLHHGIRHSVITATRDSVTCQPETCSSQQYPPRECHLSPSAIWGHHLNHAWQTVIKHTASYTNTSQDMPVANVFTCKLVGGGTGTNIYCKTSPLALLSWCPPITLKMMQSLHGVVSTHTKRKVACLLMYTACA